MQRMARRCSAGEEEVLVASGPNADPSRAVARGAGILCLLQSMAGGGRLLPSIYEQAGVTCRNAQRAHRIGRRGERGRNDRRRTTACGRGASPAVVRGGLHDDGLAGHWRLRRDGEHGWRGRLGRSFALCGDHYTLRSAADPHDADLACAQACSGRAHRRDHAGLDAAMVVLWAVHGTAIRCLGRRACRWVAMDLDRNGAWHR